MVFYLINLRIIENNIQFEELLLKNFLKGFKKLSGRPRN